MFVYLWAMLTIKPQVSDDSSGDSTSSEDGMLLWCMCVFI